MKKIEIGDIVSRAWDLAVKHWPIFLLITIISSFVSGIGVKVDPVTAMEALSATDPITQLELLEEAIQTNYIAALIGFLLNIYLSFLVLNFYVNATRNGKPYDSLAEALKIDFNQLAIFFCVEVCYAIIVALGCCLLILPGIWLAVRLWYAPLLAATQGATFGEAIKGSWEMTKGHFWELFLMGLTMIGISILGLCAFFVGVFFAEVIIDFMLVVSFLFLLPSSTPEEEPGIGNADYVEVQ